MGSESEAADQGGHTQSDGGASLQVRAPARTSVQEHTAVTPALHSQQAGYTAEQRCTSEQNQRKGES